MNYSSLFVFIYLPAHSFNSSFDTKFTCFREVSVSPILCVVWTSYRLCNIYPHIYHFLLGQYFDSTRYCLTALRENLGRSKGEDLGVFLVLCGAEYSMEFILSSYSNVVQLLAILVGHRCRYQDLRQVLPVNPNLRVRSTAPTSLSQASLPPPHKKVREISTYDD